METMDELLDNIITDDSPSQISDAIKDMLYAKTAERVNSCLLYTSPSPRDVEESRMPSSA